MKNLLFIFLFLLLLMPLESCKRSRSTISRNSTRESPSRDSSQNETSNISNRRQQELKSIYEYTINYWQYDETAYSFNYTPQQRLRSGRGVCWDYALFFYNESIKRGLNDVHFVVSINLQHAWNEIWVEDKVYIFDATWGDTNPYESIDKYFMVNASLSKDHYANDICVVDETMDENDISSLYQGIIVQDSKRQRYTAARPIVKLTN
jgi:transglutaminase-like putative cysteine protease